jgi:TonB-dependent receptor
MRETLYVFSSGVDDFRLRDQTQSGFRQFVETSDTIWELAFDVSKFLNAGSFTGTIKGGAAWMVQDRYFNTRRFRFTHRSTSGLDLTQSPETLFSPEFIGPNFEIREDTRATDQYVGEHEIKAGYGMADLQFGSRWRVIAGARVEQSKQTLDSFDLFAVDPTVISTDLDDTDVMPSVNVVYAASSRMNLRVAFSQTVNRPNFRELAPFDFTDVTGGHSVVGNPDLVRTSIDNYDVRWEWFTGPTDLVAFSVFYKEFEDPIEQTFQPTAQLRISYLNVDRAQNRGFETEIRQQLGGISEALSNFAISGNYTFVDSEVDYGDADLSLVTSLNRPLAGQSRHIVNTALDYNNPRFGHNSRILYNYVGRRISDVGALGLPDIYEGGQHLMDFVMRQRIGGEDSPLELKFSVDNLLDDEKEFTQGGHPYRVYRKGRTFGVGMSYDFF